MFDDKNRLERMWSMPETAHLCETTRYSLFDQAVRRVNESRWDAADVALRFSIAAAFLSTFVLLPSSWGAWLWFPCVLATFLALRMNHRRRVRRELKSLLVAWSIRPSQCFSCGYDLRGSAPTNCPECGEKLVHSDRT